MPGIRRFLTHARAIGIPDRGSRRYAPDELQRASDNLFPSRVVTIETAAMAEDILAIVRRWDKAFCRFIDAP